MGENRTQMGSLEKILGYPRYTVIHYCPSRENKLEGCWWCTYSF